MNTRAASDKKKFLDALKALKHVYLRRTERNLLNECARSLDKMVHENDCEDAVSTDAELMMAQLIEELDKKFRQLTSSKTLDLSDFGLNVCCRRLACMARHNDLSSSDLFHDAISLVQRVQSESPTGCDELVIDLMTIAQQDCIWSLTSVLHGATPLADDLQAKCKHLLDMLEKCLESDNSLIQTVGFLMLADVLPLRTVTTDGDETKHGIEVEINDDFVQNFMDVFQNILVAATKDLPAVGLAGIAEEMGVRNAALLGVVKMLQAETLPSNLVKEVIALDVLYPDKSGALDSVSKTLRQLLTPNSDDWSVDLECLQSTFEKIMSDEHRNLFKQFATTIHRASSPKWPQHHVYKFVQEGITYAMQKRERMSFLQCLQSLSSKVSSSDAKKLVEHARHLKSSTSQDSMDDDDDDDEVWQPYNVYIDTLEQQCTAEDDESEMSTPQKRRKVDASSPDSAMASQRSNARKPSASKSGSGKKRGNSVVSERMGEDGSQASSALSSPSSTQKSSSKKGRGKPQKEPIVPDADGFMTSRRRTSKG